MKRYYVFMRTVARRFPVFPFLQQFTQLSPFAWLTKLAQQGLQHRYASLESRIPQARQRLDHELSVVAAVGYTDYFLIVWDIVRYAKTQHIPCLARGSAADSLLCYVLGISTVCPLRFNLYFERFLNPERMQFSKLADIDLDFPWDQRDEIIDYVFRRYGEDYVAMIGGFNRFHARAALAELGKVMGLPESEVRAFTRRVPAVAAHRWQDAVAENAKARALPLNDSVWREVFAMAHALEDVPRHPMMHPCGLVIGGQPLADYMPLQPSARGPQMSQLDMNAIEELGFLKIDILGQAGLSVMRDALAHIRATQGVEIALDNIPWEDEATWDLISSGQARGVHHIESPAMTSLLVQTHCRDMDCLCAIVSVIRPGAADESKKLAFTRRHQGFEPAVYPHPSLKTVLADTYGLLVYEEHILMVAHHFAGMNLGRADVLRRALVKAKDAQLIQQLGEEFLASALALGRTQEEASKVWQALERFHGYMFNKAHSASYAVEAYQGAFLKTRYPAAYMAAVLSNERGFYTPLFYSLEARRLGVRFALPCVQRSQGRYNVEEDQAVRLPLNAIAGLSQDWQERWRRAREHSVFTTLWDFLARTAPSKQDQQLLLKAGALDVFHSSRTALFWTLQQQGDQSRAAVGTSWLLPGEMVTLTGLPEPSMQEMAQAELELFGYPVSMDPFNFFGAQVDWDSYCPLSRLLEHQDQTVQVVGLAVADRLNHTLKGDLMQFVTLASPEGFLETTMFPRVYRQFGHLLNLQRVVALQGKVQAFENGRGCILDVQSVLPVRRRRQGLGRRQLRAA